MMFNGICIYMWKLDIEMIMLYFFLNILEKPYWAVDSSRHRGWICRGGGGMALNDVHNTVVGE